MNKLSLNTVIDSLHMYAGWDIVPDARMITRKTVSYDRGLLRQIVTFNPRKVGWKTVCVPRREVLVDASSMTLRAHPEVADQLRALQQTKQAAA